MPSAEPTIACWVRRLPGRRLVVIDREEHPMKLPRRRLLHLAAGAAALPAMRRLAWAQSYPSKPLRIILGYPAGDSPDIVARIMGRWLSERLGQSVVVENKPGAGTNIAVQAAVDSPPDGYTLLLMTTANASNVTFYDTLRFSLLRDIAPVAGLMRTPLVMDVNPTVPAKTVSEFIAYAKANPGKINMASAGVGGLIHLAGELFKATTGVNMLHVPYRGSPPAITDLIGNRVQVMFDALPTSLPHIRSGALRALAVTTATRSDALPEVPTVGESVPGYDAGVWVGAGVPSGTPPEIIEKLNREINAGLANPGIKAQLADLGAAPMPFTPAEFGGFVAAETEKWGKVIRAGNIKPE
jgi:tripartite-type tricarboxylate transporter receptor subunit TctC